MDTIIITHAAECADEARAELGAALSGAKGRPLALGVTAVSVPDAREAAESLREATPIFIRHIVAATHEVALDGPPEARLAAILGLVAEVCGTTECARDAVGVQIRVMDGTASGPTRAELWQRLAPTVEPLFQLNTRTPSTVLSVIVSETHAWVALNETALNLSAWAGGARHFAHGASEVSRAGFKLEEALELFGVALRPGTQAADLGAAPGGWTAVLARAGLKVDAIDPARLDPRVLAMPGVRHHRCRTDRYATDAAPGSLDIIVNDMRIDALEAADLLIELAPCLASGADVITTLKLPKRGMVLAMSAALARMERSFTVQMVRHLFHNRSEVTAWLKKR